MTDKMEQGTPQSNAGDRKISWTERKIERRSFIKKSAIAGGAAAAALYVAPVMTSAMARPAYASGTPGPGKISIEFRPDDFELDISSPQSQEQATVQLCNVSGWQPMAISSWTFLELVGERVDPLGCIDSIVLPDPNTFPDLQQVCGACEPGVDPDAVCADFVVTFNMNSNWTSSSPGKEVKVKIKAIADGAAETFLTVSLVRT